MQKKTSIWKLVFSSLNLSQPFASVRKMEKAAKDELFKEIKTYNISYSNASYPFRHITNKN